MLRFSDFLYQNFNNHKISKHHQNDTFCKVFAQPTYSFVQYDPQISEFIIGY